MKKILITILLFLYIPVFADTGFYVKVPSNKIDLVKNVISGRVDSLFSKLTDQEKIDKNTTFDYDFFHEYTFYVEDSATGDRYYKIEDVQYKGIQYNFAQWFIDKYPTYPRYDYEYVKQFLPEEGI